MDPVHGPLVHGPGPYFDGPGPWTGSTEGVHGPGVHVLYFPAKVCLTAVEIQMFGYQACHVCAQLEHVFLPRVHA